MRGPEGWTSVWRRVRRDWPGKIGAVVVALVLWWVASGDASSTAQRSLLVPLQVVGAEAHEVAVGVPARVEVVVSGPGDRLDRLRADEVDATLDLSGIDGEFARPVEAEVPPGLQRVRVVPSEVIGRLEAVRSRRFAVVPVVAAAAPGSVVISLSSDPVFATVEARDPVLELVAYVLAPLRSVGDAESDAVLVPVDASGVPVAEARVVPERATIRVDRQPLWTEVTRPVAILAPDLARVTVEEVRPAEVGLVGRPAALDALAAVRGRVPDATAELPPGRYDLPVRLELPAGVATRGEVVAVVSIRASETPRDEAPSATP